VSAPSWICTLLIFVCCYFVEDLQKILELFKKESSKDIKPLDVAKFTGIGSNKKAVNSLLHFLKNKNNNKQKLSVNQQNKTSRK
jgi:hypothetical protein